jgi:hypothetical protein
LDTSRVGDLDVIFASFDEPWADEFFEDLRSKVPQAQRVHGVKGHNHKIRECGRIARTDRFLLVDADNLLRPELLDQTFDEAEVSGAILSYRGRNVVNGLEYGNGGPACWPRSVALSLVSHEATAEGPARVDYCWSAPVYVIGFVGADVHIANTPYHAFRAGYRESVKLTLIDGEQLADLTQVMARTRPNAWRQLLMWASVGSDVPNGEWAIYGFRRGLADVWLEHLPIESINDYAWFDDYWQRLTAIDPRVSAEQLGMQLNQRFGLGLTDLDPQTSGWVKKIYLNVSRHGLMVPRSAGPAAESAPDPRTRLAPAAGGATVPAATH